MAVVKRSLQLSKPVHNRPTKLHQWSDKSMVKALDMVTSGKMGVNRVTLGFGVQCTTLKDRVVGRVTHNSNMGPKPYLNYEEEKELVEFLLNSSKMGYGIMRQDVMKLVEHGIIKKGLKLNNKLSNSW